VIRGRARPLALAREAPHIYPKMMNNNVRAAVLGATGYTGQEMVRLIRQHPRISIAAATSESEAGAPVPGTALSYVSTGDLVLDETDLVFTCMPHGESGVVGVQPFGGSGLSGTGPKAGGPHYLPRFAEERAISVNIAAQGGDPHLLNL
jgi:hypothetical protein